MKAPDRRCQRQRCARACIAALWVLGLWFTPGAAVQAQDGDADRAFTSAARLFQDGWHDRSEKELANFVTAFPNSTNRVQALLLQAQSRYQLKDFEGAFRLLESHLAGAAPQDDQFLYWMAQAQSRLDQHEPAALLFARLLKDCPSSPLRLEASYGEALARFKLGDTARTVELLRSPTGAFQQAAKGSTDVNLLIRGGFLLAEALFAQKNFQAAEETLTDLAQRGLSPETEWQRQYLLARIELGDRRGEAALLRVTNLVSIATAKTNALLQARSLTLKGEILEENQPDAAAQSYLEITTLPGVSAEHKRQASLKLVDLAVSQNRFTNAIQRLSQFLEQNPQEPAADLIRITLGEIYLRQFSSLTSNPSGVVASRPVASTNLLQAARAQFELVINQMTNSSYQSKAHLNRAWCFWEEAQLLGDASKLAESQKSLQSAIEGLPKSLEQAQARFKMADIHFQLKNYSNALSNYRLLLEQYSDLPDAKEKLLDHALYQMARAGIESQDLGQAGAAVQRLVQEFPDSPWSDQGLFVYGQALGDRGEFSKAHEIYAEFQKRFPESPLLPQVELALARDAVKQADWPSAIRRYDQWLTRFTTNESRPQAAFDRAWCQYQAGNSTNAFASFTNLVHQYPASPYAPLARLWVADYFLNQRDYRTAELYYQLLSSATNAGAADLNKHATLMAAKAAFLRQGYADARRYLTALVTDPKTSPEIGSEAWYMLGDIVLEDPSSTNKVARFEEAINHFQRVTTNTSSRLAPLAQGKIANCHFQLAAQDTTRYEMATNQYWQVVVSPLADVSTRSQAEVALGYVLERMAEQRPNRMELLNDALTHYLSVLYNKRLRKDEEADPYWLSRAALAAGTLTTDRLQRFDEAERLYQAMRQTLPSLRTTWEKRLENLRQLRHK